MSTAAAAFMKMECYVCILLLTHGVAIGSSFHSSTEIPSIGIFKDIRDVLVFLN